jgi:hypothetical protein
VPDPLLLPAYSGDRLAFAPHTAGLWPDSRAIVLCRPDAWGRVSFAATPVSIVGWIDDPDHSLPEEQQIYVGNATQAQAAFDAAQQQLAQADINLQRTQVRSPVNGYVTNLLMRVGDYAHAGTNNISVIDADSY